MENQETLADRWAKKAALGYRQPLLRASRPYRHNIVTAASLMRAVCEATPKDGPLLYSLPGTHRFATAADAIEYDAVHTCGPSLVDQPSVTIQLDASDASVKAADRKLLCLMKSVGTPYATYQLRTDGTTGELLYQTANASGWSGSLAVPKVFRGPNEVARIAIVHEAHNVSIYVNGTLVASSSTFAALEYSDVTALWIGKRLDSEAWNGTLGNVLIRRGSWRPRPTNATSLPASELSALMDIHTACGGAQWRYRHVTDAVGGGLPWISGTDPCNDGWFGVKCNEAGDHITQLFPNTRFSGNPLSCELPTSIGNLSHLEHLYTSNDKTPSSLRGAIPTTLGKLSKLKCMYFSHNQLSGSIPTELEGLTQLQVFLMRCNKLSGPLIDFSRLTQLRNVWFDTNQLTGTLSSVGALPNLTFLQASNNAGIGGELPASLCDLECTASGTNVSCSPSLPSDCCRIKHCGTAPPAPPPPAASMGECFPQ